VGGAAGIRGGGYARWLLRGGTDIAEAQRFPSRPQNGIASSRIFFGLIDLLLDRQYLLLSGMLRVKRNLSVSRCQICARRMLVWRTEFLV
jgi:hypothetical protein